jgi:C-terminal processing protease CtpA/Prc
MALETARDTKIIGSQTAGADGNVSLIRLPGGIYTYFTGLGVYYPDGGETQRVGIVPDIVVRPTIGGIRSGRDEVLETALDYINFGTIGLLNFSGTEGRQ